MSLRVFVTGENVFFGKKVKKNYDPTDPGDGCVDFEITEIMQGVLKRGPFKKFPLKAALCDRRVVGASIQLLQHEYPYKEAGVYPKGKLTIVISSTGIEILWGQNPKEVLEYYLAHEKVQNNDDLAEYLRNWDKHADVAPAEENYAAEVTPFTKTILCLLAILIFGIIARNFPAYPGEAPSYLQYIGMSIMALAGACLAAGQESQRKKG